MAFELTCEARNPSGYKCPAPSVICMSAEELECALVALMGYPGAFGLV